jgi:succinate dehydrogenase / fumarate reductase cytochrome b subunit
MAQPAHCGAVRAGRTPYNAEVHPDEPGPVSRLRPRLVTEANLQVRYLQYRGGEGMLAWAFHRISGVAIWAFVLLHVLDIWLVGANRGLYDEVLKFYASPVGRVGETLLGAALLYHALNGLRIIVMDFWPSTTVFHKQLWYASWVVFVVVGLPGAYIILRPIWAGAS